MARRTSSSGKSPPSAVSDDEYKVGPGRPPREHQFVPGQSGNPKGARKKPKSAVPDLKEMFESAFNKKVTVTREGGKKDLITKMKAGFEQLANQFAKGDKYARRDVFLYAEKLGVSSFNKGFQQVADELQVNDQEIVDRFVARKLADKDCSPHSPTLAPPELSDDDISDTELVE